MRNAGLLTLTEIEGRETDTPKTATFFFDVSDEEGGVVEVAARCSVK